MFAIRNVQQTCYGDVLFVIDKGARGKCVSRSGH